MKEMTEKGILVAIVAVVAIILVSSGILENFFVNMTGGAILTFDSVDAEKFVKEGYHYVLGKEASSGGLKYWTEQIENKGLPRKEFILALYNMEEYQSANKISFMTDDIFVKFLYLDLLGRKVDAGSWSYYVNLLNNRTKRADVAMEIIKDSEFSSAFEKFINSHEDCAAYWEEAAYTGLNDEIGMKKDGIYSGRSVYLCYQGRFYKCISPLSGEGHSFAIGKANGDQVGNWKCDLAFSKWVVIKPVEPLLTNYAPI